MTEQFITYFGYGSLVNRDTRPVGEQAYPARLHGWQRAWGHRVQAADVAHDVKTAASFKSCCSLSVEKIVNKTQSTSFIDGVVVTIPLADLPVLDEREAGYDRVKLPASDFTLPSECTSAHVYVYVSNAANAGRSSEQFPILQSYVDCVLAGYCTVFEHLGMQQFVDSTVGWNGFIENDRSSPRYPRAVQLPQAQLALFDRVVTKRCLKTKG